MVNKQIIYISLQKRMNYREIRLLFFSFPDNIYILKVKMFALVRVRTLSTRSCQRCFQNFDEFTQKAEEKSRQNESKKQKADEDDLFKSKILISSLSFVPDHGWSKEAITKGTV